MTEHRAEGGGPQLDLCPFCGKKIADSSRAGSLTSFLFQGSNCQCGVRQTQSSKSSLQHLDRTFCPRCGLQIGTGSSAGSLTGFLFQDIRCKCPPEAAPSAERDRARQVYKSVELAPGVVIGDQYRIINIIGRGGMGEVYLAQHLTLEKNCAIKLIPPDQVTDMGWQRFQIEARSVAKLDHVNIVKVTDFGIHKGCLPYYAMEFVDGLTLAEMLEKRGTMPLNVALEVFMQVCDGVDYAHRSGIVHRDLKPGNIMMVTLPTGRLAVKIMDFGLAKLTQDDRGKQSLTSVGEVFGSPFYMSPEQCVGGKIDNRSDIYSLGCTMFESLAGRPPFVGSTAVDIVSGHQGADVPSLESVVGRNVFPQAIEVVLAKLLRKNPVERYQTLLELRGDLERVLRGEEVQPFFVSRRRQVSGAAGEGEFSTTGAGGDQDALPHTLLGGRGLIIGLLAVGLLGCLVTALYVGLGRSPDRSASGGVANRSLEGQGRGLAVADPMIRETEVPKAAHSLFSGAEDGVPDPGGSDSFLQKNFPNAIDSNDTDQKAPASLNDTTAFASIVVENGVRLRVFNFPQDIVIGEFQPNTSMPQVLARGKFKFLPEGHCVFIAYPILTKYPGYLKRFRSGDVYTVRFHPGGSGKPDDLLAVMTQLGGVQELILTGCRELTNSCIPMIEKFHSLRALALGDDNNVKDLAPLSLDASAIAHLSTLKQLESLNVQGYDDVLPILHMLKNSAGLKELNLSRSRVTDQGLADIVTLTRLQTLNLDTLSLSTTALESLSRLPALENLTVGSLPLDKTAISSLHSFKSLKRLTVGAAGLSTDGQSRLQKALPGVTVVRQI